LETYREGVIGALKTVFDQEIPVDIYEMGLVYDVDVDGEGGVVVRMTLTSPMCPAAGQIPVHACLRIAALPWVRDVRVEVVWDPPWTPERMTEAAKLELGLF